MQNSDLSRQIDYAFRRVAKIGEGWSYVPIFRLPPATEIVITCDTACADPEPPDINGQPEQQVVRLEAGTYTLLVLPWPSILLNRPGKTTLIVKAYAQLLSPGSQFCANFDQDGVTFRLTTGVIRGIIVPGTKYRLSDTDKPVDKKPSYQRKRKNSSYQPLREKMHVQPDPS